MTRRAPASDGRTAETLTEEGAAAMVLAGLGDPPVHRQPALSSTRAERLDVIVIGGGQAGLAVGHYLSRAGVRYVILDANERVGDAWRQRWDSLRLFTPAKFDALPGLRFPAPRNSFPTKDEMAAYLERYASHFQLPVRSGVRVSRLAGRGDRYVVQAPGLELEASQVVVAMSNYQRPRVPRFGAELSPSIRQLHSSEYRHPRQLRPGRVLLAGAGNSGAEIAVEAARAGHPTSVAGPSTGQVPFRPGSVVGRNVFGPMVLRFVFHRVLTIKTPLGRRARPAIIRKGAPLIRTHSEDLAAAGVERLPRVVGVRDGRPLLEGGQVVDAANVIWCTGFHPGFDWIDLPIHDEQGEPRHDGGVVMTHPGLYFVGLHFLYAMSSGMIHGVGRDAARIARSVTARIGASDAA